MDIQVPESFDDLTDEQLQKLGDDLTAAFDEAYDSETPTPVAELSALADAIESVRVEQRQRDEQANAEADARADLAKRVHTDDPAAEAEQPEAEQPQAEVETATEPEAEAEQAEVEPEPVAASGHRARRPSSAAAVHTHSIKPEPVETPHADLVITASADVPGYSNGQTIDKHEIAKAMHARARGLGDSQGRRTRFGVASIQRLVPDHLMHEPGQDLDDLLRQAVDEVMAGADAKSLVASGGWCAPSETLYDFFSVESRDGLLDMPTVGVTRGGVQYPNYVGPGAITGGLFTWSEDVDGAVSLTLTDIDVATGTATATSSVDHNLATGDTVVVTGTGFANLDGTYTVTVTGAATFTFTTTAVDTTNQVGTATIVKGCFQIPCPGMTEVRLGAEGACLTHGNLMNRAWPEATARYVDLTVTAHLHRLSNAQLAAILATATAVTVTSVPSDAAGDILNAIDLQVADYRSEHLMSENVVLEALIPQWWIEAIRATLAMRNGIDKLAVTGAMVREFFTVRNIRPQFLAGYDPLYRAATPAVAWPATSTMTLYPAGGYAIASGGTLDLGVIRDSTLNPTNDFTALWSETFWGLIQRGPAAREVTVNVDVDGQTGGPEFLGV